MDVKELVAEAHVGNIDELEEGLVKVKNAIEYLVETGILRIPEDVSMEQINKRIGSALMNTMKLKFEYVDNGD